MFVFVFQVISQLMVFMVSNISMVFCGHLGTTELTGVSLTAADTCFLNCICVYSGLPACNVNFSHCYFHWHWFVVSLCYPYISGSVFNKSCFSRVKAAQLWPWSQVCFLDSTVPLLVVVWCVFRINVKCMILWEIDTTPPFAIKWPLKWKYKLVIISVNTIHQYRSR